MDAAFIDKLTESLERKPVVHQIAGLTPFMSVPNNYKTESLHPYLPSPLRVQQTVQMLTAADFAAYWERFKNDSSVIFADERSATYKAIIDYHSTGGQPQWCEHTATYACPHSPEFKIWRDADGKQMGQPQFAEFIEDNYPDVTNPAHATMLEMSSNLQAKKSVNFAQATRLDNGQTQLTYQEQVSGTVETKGGSMKVPETFEITIPVFLGGAPAKINARLRYRINDGKLVMWYQLHRPAKVVEEAVRQVTATIRKAIGTDPMYLGAP